VAVLREGADEQVGVVVALARALDELAGRVEQLGDRRHGERAEEGELEGAGEVDGELEAGVQVDDPLCVVHGIEPPDLAQVARLAHRVPPAGFEPALRP
jgi:hypothetical protein